MRRILSFLPAASLALLAACSAPPPPAPEHRPEPQAAPAAAPASITQAATAYKGAAQVATAQTEDAAKKEQADIDAAAAQ
jgi:hypothetical protein